MNKLLKISAGVIVVAAVAWPAAAWYTGKRAEEVIRQQVADLNTRMQGNPVWANFRVDILELTRGVFSSQERLSLVYHPTAAASGGAASTDQQILLLRGTIHHGPFPLDRPLSLAMASVTVEPESAPYLKPWFDIAHGVPFSESTLVHYNGALNGVLTVQPVDFSDGKDTTVKFSGSKVNFSKSGSDDKITVDGGFDTFHLATIGVSGAAVQADVSGVSLDAWSRPGASGLALGDGQISIQQIKLATSADKTSPTVINKLAVKTSSEENNGMLSARVNYQIGMVNVAGKDFAGATINLSAKNLAVAPIKSLLPLYYKFETARMARMTQALESNDPDQAQKALKDPGLDVLTPQDREQLLTAGMALLAGKPSITIDPIQVQNAKGQAQLTVQIDLAKPDDNAQGLDKIAQIIPHAQAKLTLPTALVSDLVSQVLQLEGENAETADRTASQQVGLFGSLAVMSGYVSQKDGQLVSSLTIGDNIVDINGKKMPLKDLLGNLPNPAGDAEGEAPDNDAEGDAPDDAENAPGAPNAPAPAPGAHP